MTLQQALQLIRAKYKEEQEGVFEGETTERYNRACDTFPVTMKTAQGYWNQEISKQS